MTPKQEEALREWLQEAIVPLIEQVLVKKLGQAMTYASKELIQPKREWQGLTDEEIKQIEETTTCEGNESWLRNLTRNIEAKLREKNT
jgi:hypothetical protein